MKYVIYVLEDCEGKRYTGATGNLLRRLREHRGGHTRTTRKMSDLRVVYSEEVDDWSEARKRELYLKSAAGRKFLSKILPR